MADNDSIAPIVIAGAAGLGLWLWFRSQGSGEDLSEDEQEALDEAVRGQGLREGKTHAAPMSKGDKKPRKTCAEGLDDDEKSACHELSKFSTPMVLDTWRARKPKKNAHSHRDGRAPWLTTTAGHARNDSVKGFVMVDAGGLRTLFCWTGDKSVWNYHTLADERANVGLFVTEHGGGNVNFACAWHFTERRFLARDEVALRQLPQRGWEGAKRGRAVGVGNWWGAGGQNGGDTGWNPPAYSSNWSAMGDHKKSTKEEWARKNHGVERDNFLERSWFPSHELGVTTPALRTADLIDGRTREEHWQEQLRRAGMTEAEWRAEVEREERERAAEWARHEAWLAAIPADEREFARAVGETEYNRLKREADKPGGATTARGQYQRERARRGRQRQAREAGRPLFEIVGS